MGAYFETVKMLMYAFFFLFLVTIPSMYMFSTNTGIKDDYMGIVT